jgi:nucleotide-binding universal stress UspA family protein
MAGIKKILFPYDLSETASKITPYVLSVADAFNSGVYLLHVVHDLNKWGKVYIPHASMDVFQQAAIEEAKKAMDSLCEEQLRGCDILGKKAVAGKAAAEILETIESEEIDMVIMGTHGRKGIEHLIMGSVASKVVRQSPVPVMTVNPDSIG